MTATALKFNFENCFIGFIWKRSVTTISEKTLFNFFLHNLIIIIIRNNNNNYQCYIIKVVFCFVKKMGNGKMGVSKKLNKILYIQRNRPDKK